MIRRTAAFFLSVTLLLVVGLPGQPPPPQAVAIEGVTVIPMDRDRTLPNHTVVVQGGRITAVGPADQVTVPSGARRIDGSGKFLIPGLAEMHAHVPGPALPQAVVGEDYLERVLFLFAANGITTIRGMLGAPMHLELKSEIARGDRIGPQLFTSGPSINGNSVPTTDAARRSVTDQRASGYDLLKIHPGLSREAFDEVVAVAHREGIPFAGHVPVAVGIERALSSGYASVEHLDGYMEYLADAVGQPSQFFGFNFIDSVDESRIEAIAMATYNAGVWNTATQTLFEDLMSEEPVEQIAQRPEMRFMPDSMVRVWVQQATNLRSSLNPEQSKRYLEVRYKLIQALVDVGAGLVLGSDAPQIFNVPGFSTLQELEALVKAGLTPYQALEAGTVNPARYFGLEAAFGTIEVGKRADLVLLNANPLENISNVKLQSGVMVAGRWMSSEEIEEGMAKWGRT